MNGILTLSTHAPVWLRSGSVFNTNKNKIRSVFYQVKLKKKHFFEKFGSMAQSKNDVFDDRMWLFIEQFEDVHNPVCIFVCLLAWPTCAADEVCCWRINTALPAWLKIKKWSFFPPQLDTVCPPHTPPQLPLHLFLPSFSMKWEGMGFLQHEQRWHYCQHELPIVAMCQAGPLPSCCHHGAQMRWENFGGFIVEEIKHGARLIWHPYLHGIRAVRHRQVSQLDQISNTYKVCAGYIKDCPSTSPYEINMA